ncbi:MAG: hypothetical protein JJE04_03830 [Acidobacteriia bacterium]|nr:hypothetical protein [Terriglobia bacterium]
MSVINKVDASPSTGPRTPEGKAISSMNALKHGFSSKNIIIMPGQEDEFQKLESGLIAEVRPEGTLEQTLFHHLLRDAWTIHRVEIQQVEMAASGIDPLFNPACEKEFDRLERYHSRYQSSFHRSLRQLRNLQTNRVVQNLLPEPLGQGGLPTLVKATEIIALAKRTGKNFNALALNTLIQVTERSRITPQPSSHNDFLNEKEIA